MNEIDSSEEAKMDSSTVRQQMFVVGTGISHIANKLQDMKTGEAVDLLAEALQRASSDVILGGSYIDSCLTDDEVVQAESETLHDIEKAKQESLERLEPTLRASEKMEQLVATHKDEVFRLGKKIEELTSSHKKIEELTSSHSAEIERLRAEAEQECFTMKAAKMAGALFEEKIEAEVAKQMALLAGTGKPEVNPASRDEYEATLLQRLKGQIKAPADAPDKVSTVQDILSRIPCPLAEMKAKILQANNGQTETLGDVPAPDKDECTELLSLLPNTMEELMPNLDAAALAECNAKLLETINGQTENLDDAPNTGSSPVDDDAPAPDKDDCSALTDVDASAPQVKFQAAHAEQREKMEDGTLIDLTIDEVLHSDERSR